MANPSFQNIPEESMKWVTASYLLEAKQHIDSIEYISKNIFKLPRYGASTLIPMHFDSFYIECACVLDRFCKNTQQKKSLKDCHPEIGTIYWWRDKQAAHHDESVLGKGLFGLVSEWPNILSKMKRELGCVYSVCKPILPSVFTLDYVTWDKFAFRVIKGLTPKREDELLRELYPLHTFFIDATCSNPQEFTLLNNVDDVCRVLSAGVVVNRNKFAIKPMDNGLSFYEGLQNRQYWCVLMNIWSGTNLWARPKDL